MGNPIATNFNHRLSKKQSNYIEPSEVNNESNQSSSSSSSSSTSWSRSSSSLEPKHEPPITTESRIFTPSIFMGNLFSPPNVSNDNQYRPLKSYVNHDKSNEDSKSNRTWQPMNQTSMSSSTMFSTKKISKSHLTNEKESKSIPNDSMNEHSIYWGRSKQFPSKTKHVYNNKHKKNYGLELSNTSLKHNQMFAKNFDFFRSHFQHELMGKPCDSEPSPSLSINYDPLIVQKFLKTSNKISSQFNQMFRKKSSATTTPTNNKKDKGQQSKVLNVPDSRASLRTFSGLSVDSQKSIYRMNKINKSLTLIGKTFTIISTDHQNLNKSLTKSPSIQTPTEVMVRGYVFLRETSRGSFSNLFLCSCFSMPDQELACKHIRSSELIFKMPCLKDFLDEEVFILQRVNHENIIEMYEIITTPTDIYVFMKFANKGTIYDYLYREWRKPLPETYAKRWMKHIMMALAYVHDQEIVHRDLKLENFLLDDKYTALLSDFGLAVYIPSSHSNKLLSIYCGTPEYMAPELANKLRANLDPFPADIYSMGICLFEMVNFYRPFAISFSKANYSVLYRQQHRMYQFNKLVFLEQECHLLLNLLLEPKPTIRPKAHEVLDHVWFKLQLR
ncbi:hypothetical protein BLOT_013191 [Blomia tropicalis]|nr:hypothetical protein BLOT_013191 [Blomia tropicalis]